MLCPYVPQPRIRKIRKPGRQFHLTDEELIAAPARMLNPEQRVRRRQLRRQAQTRNAREARRERRNGNSAKLIFCTGYRKDGEPCDAYCINGAKHCRAHLDSADRAKLGLPEPKPGESRRVRKPRNGGGPVVMRQVVETAVEKLVARYFAALGLEFIGFDEDGDPVVYDHGIQKGICLHGESKEGYVHVSSYPDLTAQVQVMEKLFDRVYGRAKQTTTLEGNPNRPIKVEPVRTADRAQKMAQILARSGALPASSTTQTIDVEAKTIEVEPVESPRVVDPETNGG